MTPATGNRLSELTHTLKFVCEELAKTEKELAEKRRNHAADIKEVSQRYCLLVSERYKYQSELDREVDKLIPLFEQAEALLLK